MHACVHTYAPRVHTHTHTHTHDIAHEPETSSSKLSRKDRNCRRFVSSSLSRLIGAVASPCPPSPSRWVITREYSSTSSRARPSLCTCMRMLCGCVYVRPSLLRAPQSLGICACTRTFICMCTQECTCAWTCTRICICTYKARDVRGPSGMPDNPEPSAGDDPNQVKMRSCATHPSATDSDSCLVTALASAILSGSPVPPLPSALLKRRMPST